jgi:putative sigma-54 modulation protein
MRLELTGRHIDITPAIRRTVAKKLARLERMMNDSALSAQVVLTDEKRGRRVDVTLHARGEKFLHGVGGPGTWEQSLGEAVDKIIQQAQKVKGKWQERKRRGAKGVVAEPAAETAPTPSRPARARMPRVLRASRRTVKPMSVAEATREIDVNGDGIVVFRDAETEGISVLYRRPNGELTLLQTEG